MNVGMLWFDNDNKRALNAKIERAAEYYRNKYGRSPTLCFVHPSMLPEEALNAASQEEGGTADSRREVWKSGGIEVRPTRMVLPNHFWLGINGANGNNSH